MSTPVAFSRSSSLSRVPRPLQPVVRGAVVRTRHLGLRDTDLVLAGHPKSGTTFVRIVLASAFSGEDRDFDSVREVSREVGRHRKVRPILPGNGRLLKSHELPAFPPFGRPPRVLYLVRDGRDVAVSYFYNFTRLGFTTGSMDEFVGRFLDGEVGPYGPWHEHVAAWQAMMAASPSPSALVRYEDLLDEPVPTLRTALQSLQLPLDDDALVAAVEHNDLDHMRKKESSSTFLASRRGGEGGFVRSGKAGGWRGELSDEVLRRFEAEAGPVLRAAGYPDHTAPDA